MSFQKKQLHLQMISDVIKRMSYTSLTIRISYNMILTTIFLTGALDGSQKYLASFFMIVSLLSAWSGDTFYLTQERAFRQMFDLVRKKQEEYIDFDMNPSSFVKKATTRHMFLARHLVLSYGASSIVTIFAIVEACWF